MAENTTKIPCRLESVAIDGQLGGANQIYDDTLQLFQNVINGLFYDHKDDSSVHVSQEDRDRWDNGGDNGKVAAILSFANFAGTPEQTTSPEWEYVLLDASNHILLGINHDHEVNTFVDLDEILEYVTSPDYGLIDLYEDIIGVHDEVVDVSNGLTIHINDASAHISPDDISKLAYISTFCTLNGEFEENPEWKSVILDASNHILLGINNDNKLHLYVTTDEIFDILEEPKYSVIEIHDTLDVHVSDSSIHITQSEREAWNAAQADVSKKADKSSTVSNVSYDSTGKKITKTINGSTTDVVSASAIVTDGGGIKQHQSVTNNNPTLSWGVKSKVATIGTTDINVTMPSNPNTDTKNTAGSTNNTNKLFLIGSQTQAANTQTYSRVGCYIDASGYVFSGGSRAMTFDDTFTDDHIGLICAVSSLMESSCDVSIITSQEYQWVVLDASSHILMGSKIDGSFYSAGVEVLTEALQIMVSSYYGQKYGTFASRPSNPYAGQSYFCTDKTATGGSNAGIPIWYNGTGWVDAVGGTVS